MALMKLKSQGLSVRKAFGSCDHIKNLTFDSGRKTTTAAIYVCLQKIFKIGQ